MSSLLLRRRSSLFSLKTTLINKPTYPSRVSIQTSISQFGFSSNHRFFYSKLTYPLRVSIETSSFRLGFCLNCRFFSSKAAVEEATSDGLTVEGIIGNKWTILDESESDWKSHASAIAQSIHLIKKRLQWKKLVVRLGLLSYELDKPDLWDDPVHAGKISREHGSLMGKMKEVKAFEQQLLEHIDMIKLAREENDADLESVGPQFL